jgi:hypothetical protein
MKFLRFEDFLIIEGMTTILSRISQEEPYTVNDMDDYINRLKIQYKAKTIGGGASAEILETPSREIIKVFSPNNDPAMTRFLSFAFDNLRNPLVPKIKEIRRVRATEEDRWICSVEMENLRPLSNSTSKKIDEFLHNEKWKELKMTDLKSNRKMLDQFFLEFTDTISEFSSASKREMSDLISFLKGHVEKYPEGIDFGAQNWMLRGSDIVLIDPFWPGFSKD